MVNSHLIYWLVVRTNNPKRARTDEEAMWRADRTGRTVSRTRRRDQQTFFNFMDNDQAHADVFADRLSGKTLVGSTEGSSFRVDRHRFT